MTNEEAIHELLRELFEARRSIVYERSGDMNADLLRELSGIRERCARLRVPVPQWVAREEQALADE